MGWIGVDLDGSLAEYHGWEGFDHIGAPIPKMVDRVKAWLQAGEEVRIMTARVGRQHGDGAEQSKTAIEKWCLEHIGMALPVTCCKDYEMIELWDDRAIQLVENTGERVDGK